MESLTDFTALIEQGRSQRRQDEEVAIDLARQQADQQRDQIAQEQIERQQRIQRNVVVWQLLGDGVLDIFKKINQSAFKGLGRLESFPSEVFKRTYTDSGWSLHGDGVDTWATSTEVEHMRAGVVLAFFAGRKRSDYRNGERIWIDYGDQYGALSLGVENGEDMSLALTLGSIYSDGSGGHGDLSEFLLRGKNLRPRSTTTIDVIELMKIPDDTSEIDSNSVLSRIAVESGRIVYGILDVQGFPDPKPIESVKPSRSVSTRSFFDFLRG